MHNNNEELIYGKNPVTELLKKKEGDIDEHN